MLELLVQLFVKFPLFALRSRLSFLVTRQISAFAEAFWFGQGGSRGAGLLQTQRTAAIYRFRSGRVQNWRSLRTLSHCAGHGSWLGMPPKRIPMISTGSDIAQAAMAAIVTANRIPGHIGRGLWNATMMSIVAAAIATAEKLIV